MKEAIFYRIYAQPMRRIIGYVIILILAWNTIEKIMIPINRKLIWKRINLVTVLGGIWGIVTITILSRDGSSSDLILIPFHSFIEARIQPELYRSMLMNVFLFFPLGLTLPYALPEKWNRKVPLSILFAMVLSIGIEFTQYHFHLGRAETDDVICNTLGCAIGTISYLLANRKKKASV